MVLVGACFCFYTRIYKFLRLENLGLSRARSFWVNGGITVFETSFTLADFSKKGNATVVSKE